MTTNQHPCNCTSVVIKVPGIQGTGIIWETLSEEEKQEIAERVNTPIQEYIDSSKEFISNTKNDVVSLKNETAEYSQETKEFYDKAVLLDQSISANAQSVSLMKASVDTSEQNVTALASQVSEYSDELVMVAENLAAIQAVDANETAISALAADLQGYPIQEFDGGEIDEENEPMNGVGGVLKVCADNIEAIKKVAASLEDASSLTNLADVVNEIGSTDYTTINETGQTGA